MEQSWLLRVPQDSETQVQIVQRRSFSYRYAYARSTETRTANDSGQDYLVIREGDRTFVFALCDGVSQSFYGDLAARILGDALVDWLWQALPPMSDADAIQIALTAYLEELTAFATLEVQQQALPPDLPVMLREVLEQKRILGSESTFVAGRVDLPGPDLPDGRVILIWMGDSRLRLWESQPMTNEESRSERTAELGNAFHTAERWSSRHGPVGGRPHVFVIPIEQNGHCQLAGLTVYSDGLTALDEFSYPVPNPTIQDLIARSSESATSDDISFLELWIGQLPDIVGAEYPLSVKVPTLAIQQRESEPSLILTLPKHIAERKRSSRRYLTAGALGIICIIIVTLLKPSEATSPQYFFSPPTATLIATATVTSRRTLTPATTATATRRPTPTVTPIRPGPPEGVYALQVAWR